jgi:hypothetical protein
MTIALLLAALLALGASASAQAAGGLSNATAKRLAVELARKQVRTQGVVAYSFGRARRVNGNTVAFTYNARTKKKAYCVSVLTVTARQSGRVLRLTARIGRQKCIGIPSDALAFERATRVAKTTVGRHAAATRRGLLRVADSVKRCRTLTVPRSRRAAARAIENVAAVDALVGPNASPLADFVRALSGISTDTTALSNAAVAWSDWYDAVTSLPRLSYPCATLHRWQRAGWAADQSPIDMAAYRSVERRTVTDVKAIARGERYLASVGVFRAELLAFIPEGLLTPASS